MDEPFVSVIVAVRNGEATISKCVRSLLALAYPAYEVIVVDDGSTDGTLALLGEFFSRIRVISLPRNVGPSEARNIAAKDARGELIAFTDGDCLADARWLAELVRCFRESECAGAGGSQGVPEDESPFGRLVARFLATVGFMTDYMRAPGVGIAAVDHNASCNVMYRKAVFLAAGGFLRGFWPGEDVELDFRLRKKGHVLRFNPAARVLHYRVGSLRAFRRMMYRYGWAQGFLVRRYGFFRKIHYVALLPALLLMLIPVSLLNPSVGIAAAALLAFIFLAVLGFDLRLIPLGFPGFLNWIAGFYSSVARLWI
jgi:GT2 family glycosyltransferase